MSPYPASLFKLQVAYPVLEQVDAGRLPLAAVRRMITVSDNQATQELLRLLAATPGVEASNDRLRQLGLETIQRGGIDPTTGGNWQLGQITMTALDSVKLLLQPRARALAQPGRPAGAQQPQPRLAPAAAAAAGGSSLQRSPLHQQHRGHAAQGPTAGACEGATGHPGAGAAALDRSDQRRGAVPERWRSDRLRPGRAALQPQGGQPPLRSQDRHHLRLRLRCRLNAAAAEAAGRPLRNRLPQQPRLPLRSKPLRRPQQLSGVRQPRPDRLHPRNPTPGAPRGRPAAAP